MNDDMNNRFSTSSAAIFYFASYLVAIAAVLFWPPLINGIFTIALIFIPVAWVLSKTKATVQRDTKFSKAFVLWGFQSIGFLVTLTLSALWLAQFPQNSTRSTPNFAQHLSLSLIFSSIFLSCLLIMFCSLAVRAQKPISILLFFPPQQKLNLLANMGNYWFFRATMLPSLLLFIFSCQIIMSHFSINMAAVVVSILLISLLLRLPWLYGMLQIMIKRWHFSFMHFIVIYCIAVALSSFFIQWLMLPLQPFNLMSLSTIGSHSPLLLFWGIAISLAIPITYCVAPKILRLSPRSIFWLCLTNPLLWLIFFLDYHEHLLYTLAHLPTLDLNVLSLITLIFSFFWLGSARLAHFTTLFFGNLSQAYQGPMPRSLVLRSFSILLFLLIASIIHAVFVLQIEFLVTGACTLISCIIAVYLFLFRAPYEP